MIEKNTEANLGEYSSDGNQPSNNSQYLNFFFFSFFFSFFLLLNSITIIIYLPLSQTVNNQKKIIINTSNII